MKTYYTTRFLWETDEWEVVRVEPQEEGGVLVDQISGPYNTEPEAADAMVKLVDAMESVNV